MTSLHFTLITVIWGQKLIYEFEIWHATYSHVCSIHIIRPFKKMEILDFRAFLDFRVLFFWESPEKQNLFFEILLRKELGRHVRPLPHLGRPCQ